MNSKNKCGRKGLLFLLIVPIILGGLTATVMWLWNEIVPELFGIAHISFWQALGLLVLCKILFGGFGCGGRRKFGRGPGFRRKWRNMNEEEKEQFKERWKMRCRE